MSDKTIYRCANKQRPYMHSNNRLILQYFASRENKVDTMALRTDERTYPFHKYTILFKLFFIVFFGLLIDILNAISLFNNSLS